MPPSTVEDEAAWELEARYLALGLVAVIAVLSPKRALIGGGVMLRPRLLTRVQQEVVALMNGYLDAASVGPEISTYVTSPALRSRAGVPGAIALASSAGGHEAK